MHQWWQFGENMSNTFQDIVLTMFGTYGDRLTDSRTARKHNTFLATLHWWRQKTTASTVKING